MSNLKKRYEKEYTSMWAAMEHVSENEHNKLVELCQRNCWIKRNELAFRLQSLTEEMNGGHAGMTMKRKRIFLLRVFRLK